MRNPIQEDLLLNNHYSLAYRAYSNISFSPEKRAKQCIESHSEELQGDINLLTSKNVDSETIERYTDGYVKKFTAWLSAKSNCISSMITGPAKFPVRKAEKANEREHNRMVEFMDWRKKVLHKLTKDPSTDIVKGAEGALEKLQAKLAKAEEQHELMKTCNKIARDKAGNKIFRLVEAGLSEELAIKLMKSDRNFSGKTGFAGFELSNSNQRINNLRKDIAAEERRLAKYEDGNKEHTVIINGESAKVIENAEANRLQLIFEGKPSDETRHILKRNGYRWSPRFTAWQRQLTENALWSLKRIQQPSAN